MAINVFFIEIIYPNIYAMAKLGARVKCLVGSVVCWDVRPGVRDVGIDVFNCEFDFALPKEIDTMRFPESIQHYRTSKTDVNPVSQFYLFSYMQGLKSSLRSVLQFLCVKTLH